MSLNDGYTGKQQARAELEELVAAFQKSGGAITRGREHRASALCPVCSARRSVSAEKALNWKLHCHRCGADAKVEW
jgi:hypothetical protein